MIKITDTTRTDHLIGEKWIVHIEPATVVVWEPDNARTTFLGSTIYLNNGRKLDSILCVEKIEELINGVGDCKC